MSDASTLSRRYTTMLVAALSLIALSCVAVLMPVPYVMMRPGPAFDTLGEFEGKPMFTFGKDVKVYPTEGSLDFTTVSVTRADRSVSLAEAVKAYFGSDNAVVPKSLIYPDSKSAKQSTQEGAAQLDSSKDSSRVAALRAAGFTVTGTPQIAAVTKGGAAEGKLRTGDQVTGVDGKKIDTPDALVKAVSTKKPGDVVTVSITRKGKSQDFAITTKPSPDDPKLPRIGVSLSVKYKFPFEINNNVGRSIGGPSAGTMFALAIYDKLTPGALTGGVKIAGTGEMAPDGTVGPIGGVRQKMAGASHNRAEIFLVPAANCAEAADGDNFGLKLVKITKLDDAISSLEALAENPKAKVPSCS
ncbi:MAG: PDZ domain-containing protein [Aeromicrobium sp.]